MLENKVKNVKLDDVEVHTELRKQFVGRLYTERGQRRGKDQDAKTGESAHSRR